MKKIGLLILALSLGVKSFCQLNVNAKLVKADSIRARVDTLNLVNLGNYGISVNDTLLQDYIAAKAPSSTPTLQQVLDQGSTANTSTQFLMNGTNEFIIGDNSGVSEGVFLEIDDSGDFYGFRNTNNGTLPFSYSASQTRVTIDEELVRIGRSNTGTLLEILTAGFELRDLDAGPTTYFDYNGNNTVLTLDPDAGTIIGGGSAQGEGSLNVDSLFIGNAKLFFIAPTNLNNTLGISDGTNTGSMTSALTYSRVGSLVTIEGSFFSIDTIGLTQTSQIRITDFPFDFDGVQNFLITPANLTIPVAGIVYYNLISTSNDNEARIQGIDTETNPFFIRVQDLISSGGSISFTFQFTYIVEP